MKKTVVFTLAALAGFFAANGAAENRGGGFAAFYEQRQMQLYSAIDEALAAKAQETVTELADFKKAEVRLQTELGGRKGNIGVDIIGAFGESDTDAFGWQMRGYAAQNDSIGANVGVFYRWIEQESVMFGANAFVDYEDGDFGRFSRLGIGGEVRHGLADFSANYYKPTSDERQYTQRLNAFSRPGFDARLRVDAPFAKGLKVAADYYNFTGKRDTPAEKGFRYGMEIAPLPALNVGWYYDDNTESFGADFAYAHTIGEHNRHSRAAGAGISFDLFAPVRREYAQRIALVAGGPVPPPTGMVVTGADVPIRPDGTISPYGPRRETIAVLEFDPAFFDNNRLGEGAIILDRSSQVRNLGFGDGGDPSYVFFDDTDDRGIELRVFGNLDMLTGNPGNANTRAIGRRNFALRNLRGFPSLSRVTVSYRHDTRLNLDFYPNEQFIFSFYGFVNDAPTTVAVLTVTVQGHRAIRVDGNPLQGAVLGGAPAPIVVNNLDISHGYGNISIELMQDGNVFEVNGRQIRSRTAIPAIAPEYPPIQPVIASLTVRISDDSRHTPDVLFTSAVNGVSPISASIAYTPNPQVQSFQGQTFVRMVSVYALGGAGTPSNNLSGQSPGGRARGYAIGRRGGDCVVPGGGTQTNGIPHITFTPATPSGAVKDCILGIDDVTGGSAGGDLVGIPSTPRYDFTVRVTLP